MAVPAKGDKMDKHLEAINALREQYLAQERHVVRMTAHNPAQVPAIRAAKRIAFVKRAELAHLEQGGTRKTFDLFAAAAAARKEVR